MITQLTEAQVRDNLRNLSTYLKNTAPKDKNADFDMGTFCKVTPSYLLEPNECGTVACSIGHYALMIGWEAAGQGAKPKDRTLESDGGMTISPSGYMFWNDFCTNVIGVAKETHADLVLWRWLFSSDWQYVDGTALGAAARIDYYLINGVPKEFGHGGFTNCTSEMVDLYTSCLLPSLATPQFDATGRGDTSNP